MSADRRVPQVRLQDRQQRIDVLASRKPGAQVVHSRRVAQIVNTGAVSAAAVRDPRLPQKPSEVVVDVVERQRHVRRGAGEEPFPAWLSGERGVVAGEPFAQLLGDGQLPVLPAFRIPDLQHARVDVDILHAQQPGLRAAQPACVDRAEQDGHHQMPERHLRAVAAAVGLREQRREFLDRCRCAGRNARASRAPRPAARTRQRRGGEASGRAP